MRWRRITTEVRSATAVTAKRRCPEASRRSRIGEAVSKRREVWPAVAARWRIIMTSSSSLLATSPARIRSPLARDSTTLSWPRMWMFSTSARSSSGASEPPPIRPRTLPMNSRIPSSSSCAEPDIKAEVLLLAGDPLAQAHELAVDLVGGQLLAFHLQEALEQDLVVPTEQRNRRTEFWHGGSPLTRSVGGHDASPWWRAGHSCEALSCIRAAQSRNEPDGATSGGGGSAAWTDDGAEPVGGAGGGASGAYVCGGGVCAGATCVTRTVGGVATGGGAGGAVWRTVSGVWW